LAKESCSTCKRRHLHRKPAQEEKKKKKNQKKNELDFVCFTDLRKWESKYSAAAQRAIRELAITFNIAEQERKRKKRPRKQENFWRELFFLFLFASEEEEERMNISTSPR
jgi:hypothetical protein